MADVNRIMSQLGEHWQGTSHLLSACVGPAPEAPLGAMLLIVTLEAARTASRLTATVSGTKAVSESSAFGTHLLARPDEAGTSSRFNVLSGDSDRAPAPRLRGGRTRKEAARLRQGQLDLDLINKGRFEKSEPTIHKGEDLDVPTFIRRGIVLN